MAEQVAKQFIEALGKLESGRDVEPLVAVHADNCEVGNLIVPEHFKGPDGAREFWTEYRDTFASITSTFRNIIATDGRAALEWTSSGTSLDGASFEYDGVSILEIAGDKITRFRAYFDPKELGRQIKNTP
jgi:ketosteroid isomerase-like protein